MKTKKIKPWINALVVGKDNVFGPFQLRVPIFLADAGIPGLPYVIVAQKETYTLESTSPVTYKWRGKPLKAEVLI